MVYIRFHQCSSTLNEFFFCSYPTTIPLKIKHREKKKIKLETEKQQEWYAGLWNPQLYEPTKCLFKYIKSTIENTKKNLLDKFYTDNVVYFVALDYGI